jgi:hypothetical protein
MARRFRKLSKFHMIILPGIGRVETDKPLVGDEFARYTPHLLEELPEEVVAAPDPELEPPEIVSVSEIKERQEAEQEDEDDDADTSESLEAALQDAEVVKVLKTVKRKRGRPRKEAG